ncbi:hypothetical protein DEJ49_23850 [Streptomyces venezuelae]|uniref:Uncharacterized protein n=1 Tax=Streptomyces venezuelae TaxID=54571 RepID=A0A5P2CLC3_STRVZ|nr:hypothetical protein DEJ49_23850 [Streptomyces venezuelae]
MRPAARARAPEPLPRPRPPALLPVAPLPRCGRSSEGTGLAHGHRTRSLSPSGRVPGRVPGRVRSRGRGRPRRGRR